MDEAEPDPLAESGRYVKLRLLGKGSFGYVVQARKAGTEDVVAVKLIPRTAVNKYVEAEIINHSSMRHPHVIQFKEVFLTRKYICIAMEYATGGTLLQCVQKQGRLKEAVARWFFQQLIIGVDYCHQRGVANRDLKLENTLLHDIPDLPLPLLKICDFGYSKAENMSAAKSQVGTVTYMAPEVLIGDNRGAKYDGKVADIWSCGIMLYLMLYGKYPFDSPNDTGVLASPNQLFCMLERMVSKQYNFPADVDVSDGCRDLLQQMLLPEPARRIKVSQIMKHIWFNANLPPDAVNMNATYLNAPHPAGMLAADTIRRLMQEIRLSNGGSSSRRNRQQPGMASERPGGAAMLPIDQYQPQQQQQRQQTQHQQQRQQQPPPLPPIQQPCQVPQQFHQQCQQQQPHYIAIGGPPQPPPAAPQLSPVQQQPQQQQHLLLHQWPQPQTPQPLAMRPGASQMLLPFMQLPQPVGVQYRLQPVPMPQLQLLGQHQQHQLMPRPQHPQLLAPHQLPLPMMQQQNQPGPVLMQPPPPPPSGRPHHLHKQQQIQSELQDQQQQVLAVDDVVAQFAQHNLHK